MTFDRLKGDDRKEFRQYRAAYRYGKKMEQKCVKFLRKSRKKPLSRVDQASWMMALYSWKQYRAHKLWLMADILKRRT